MIEELKAVQEQLHNHEKDILETGILLKMVATNQKELTESMKELTKTISKMDVLLEKFAHLDTDTRDSFKRVHENHERDKKVMLVVIEDLKTDNAKLESRLDALIKLIDPILSALKYKAATGLALLGIIAMLILEVRSSVFEFFTTFYKGL